MRVTLFHTGFAEYVMGLGNALADQIASAPPTNEGPALPTTVYGARVALLGQPDGWLDIGGRKIPFWS